MVERLGFADYIDRGKISDFERGVRELDLLTLKSYADEAGVSVDDLICQAAQETAKRQTHWRLKASAELSREAKEG